MANCPECGTENSESVNICKKCWETKYVKKGTLTVGDLPISERFRLFLITVGNFFIGISILIDDTTISLTMVGIGFPMAIIGYFMI